MMRTTHTYAELEVSDSTWGEITQLLREAGYGHVFVDNKIVMNGIALVTRAEADSEEEKREVHHEREY